MAVQMLYQQEMGGSAVEQVFSSFDVDDYLSETEVPPPEPGDTVGDRAGDRVGDAAGDRAGDGAPPAAAGDKGPGERSLAAGDRSATNAQKLATAVADRLEAERARPKPVKRTPAELQERRLLVRESFDHAKKLVRGTLASSARDRRADPRRTPKTGGSNGCRRSTATSCGWRSTKCSTKKTCPRW